MAEYRVDPAQLHAARVAVAAVAEEARAELDAVHARAKEVLASWHSAAGTAFAASWHEWSSAAHTLLVVLDELAQLIGAAAVDYQHGENTVHSDVVAVQAAS